MEARHIAGDYVRSRFIKNRGLECTPHVTAANWKGVDYAADGQANESTLRVDVPYVVAPVTTQTAEAALPLVLARAGASLHRDSVATRIAEEIRTGTAKYGARYGGGGKGIIDSQKEVGGWPELRSEKAPVDSDHDGMPDEWERNQGLDPNNAADGAKLAADGYSNLEHFLNSLVEGI